MARSARMLRRRAQPLPVPLWQNGAFVRVWTASTVSIFGSLITRIALPLVAILTLGAGADRGRDPARDGPRRAPSSSGWSPGRGWTGCAVDRCSSGRTSAGPRCSARSRSPSLLGGLSLLAALRRRERWPRSSRPSSTRPTTPTCRRSSSASGWSRRTAPSPRAARRPSSSGSGSPASSSRLLTGPMTILIDAVSFLVVGGPAAGPSGARSHRHPCPRIASRSSTRSGSGSGSSARPGAASVRARSMMPGGAVGRVRRHVVPVRAGGARSGPGRHRAHRGRRRRVVVHRRDRRRSRDDALGHRAGRDRGAVCSRRSGNLLIPLAPAGLPLVAIALPGRAAARRRLGRDRLRHHRGLGPPVARRRPRARARVASPRSGSLAGGAQLVATIGAGSWPRSSDCARRVPGAARRTARRGGPVRVTGADAADRASGRTPRSPAETSRRDGARPAGRRLSAQANSASTNASGSKTRRSLTPSPTPT